MWVRDFMARDKICDRGIEEFVDGAKLGLEASDFVCSGGVDRCLCIGIEWG